MPHKNVNFSSDGAMMAIFSFLREKKEEAHTYLAQCQQLEAQLDAVNSEEDYTHLIDEVINLQNKLSDFLGVHIQHLEEHHPALLEQIIKGDKRFSFFPALIHFDEIAKQKIVTAKERLSVHELERSLPESKAKEALDFINGIKSLTGVAAIIRQQADNFREQLKHVRSEQEINVIDTSITEMSNTLSIVVQQDMQYPQDEEIATAIVHYLERNSEITAILKSFNLERQLTDDLLHARSNIAAKL